MQLVGGAIGATIGFVVGGPMGANAGWLIGGWLGGMLSPKSTQKGPDPAAMPSFNQSLRGTPIFMTFGANRVSSQIIWSKNYKPIRHSAGGKKGGAKGGGSGGMGAAKGGGSAGYYYTYTWDLVFHFGMVDTPSLIRNAWVGGDRVMNTNVSQWQAGSSLFSFFASLQSHSQSPSVEKAQITAAEYHYNAGLPTGDPDLDVWAYMTAQDGFASAWPYTAWLGFKTMEMGQTPVIPQLSVELVPVAANTDFQPDFTSQQIVGTDLTSANDFWIGTGYVIANGKHWVQNYRIEGGTTYAFGLIAIEDGTKVRLTEATFNGNSPIGASWDGRVSFGIPGTPYIYVYMTDNDTVSNYIMIYKLEDNETFTFVGVGQSKWGSQAYTTFDIAGVGVVNGNVYVANTAGIGLSTGRLSVIWQLGPVGTAPGDGGVAAAYWDNNIISDITTPMGDHFFDKLNTEGRIYQPMATFVDDGGSGYRMLVYVGKIDIAASTQSLITTLGATYPNGFTVDNTGTVVFGSFDDIGLHADGSAGAAAIAEYVSPTYQVSGSTSFLIWSRHYKDAVDVAAFGNKAHVRMYSWDGSTQTAIADEKLALYDDADAGFDNSAGGSYPRGTEFYIDADGSIKYTIFYQGIQSPITSRYISGTMGSLLFGAEDVTPPYIIYRILTSTVFGVAVSNFFGFSVNASRIDQASYLAAVQYCEDSGIKIAVTYTNQDDLLNVFDALLSLYQGFLVEVGGKIFFGLAQEFDDTGVTVDNRQLIGDNGKPPVATTLPAQQDSYNQIQYNYIDRKLDYKNNQIELSDEVDIDINGPRAKEFAPRFVMPGSLAQMEAERALWGNLYGKTTRTFKLGWNRSFLAPGDVITLVDSFDALLSSGVKVRITRKKENKRGVFDITAVDHIPYQITANHSFSLTSSPSITGDYIVPPLPADFRMYEVPKEFQGAQAKTYVGYNQKSAVMGAQLHLSADGSNFSQVADVQPYCISGIIMQSLPKRPHGWMEENVEIYLMPSSGFDPNTPTTCQTHELDDVSQAMRAVGLGNILINSEICAVEGVNLLGVNHYRISRMFRGWGGTPTGAITSGTQWHYHGSGIFEHEITEDDIGTTLFYKVVPYNFVGVPFNIASIDARTYSILGLYWLPRYGTPLTVSADSSQAGPGDAFVDQYRAVFSGDGVNPAGSSILLKWPAAANNEGYGASAYGNGGFGHFAADILTPAYRVDVLSKNAHPVSSFFVNTGYFSYTLAQNSTDFNGFGKDLIFSVMPYNVKGDGPVASVRSISLFW